MSLNSCNSTSAIMPSALVGTALLTTSQRALSRQQLVQRVEWLIGQVRAAGGNVGALTKAAEDLTTEEITALVDNAVDVLGTSLVAVDKKKLLEPVYYPADEFKLSYYRNQTVFLFVSESIVSVAIYTLLRTTYRSIPYDELENKVLFLSKLLSGEFVYGPEGLETNFQQTLDKLEKHKVISRVEQNKIRVNLAEIQKDIQVFDLFCYFVWPYVDGYWSVMLSLFVLPPGRAINEREFYKMAQSIARTLYAQGEIVHSEALNQEMIKFAVQNYESQGIVLRIRDEVSNVQLLSLAPKYEPKIGPDGEVLLEGPLYEMSEELALSRNKPLRYGVTQTITKRLLSLVAPAAAQLSVPRM